MVHYKKYPTKFEFGSFGVSNVRRCVFVGNIFPLFLYVILVILCSRSSLVISFSSISAKTWVWMGPLLVFKVLTGKVTSLLIEHSCCILLEVLILFFSL